LLREEGYLPADAAVTVAPLTGGVSSDVFRLDTPNGTVCVKRALPALRVQADWRVSPERARSEVEWLRAARAWVGEAVPEVLHQSASAPLFVMSWFDPAAHTVWKADLASGRTDPGFAAAVGARLGQIHAGAAGSPALAERFDTTELFEALRLDPFIRHAARAHPDLSARLIALADRTASARISLVHGDVSPKNILHGPDGPVFLDAECAWYGDPAFDLAFCTTHLLLKSVWKPAHAPAFCEDLVAFRQSYLAAVSWEAPSALDRRAAELTAAVLLARVDGKSPAEYLQSDADRSFVRAVARQLVAETPRSTAALADVWSRELKAR
jgi:aminoglycoside phosphotransferase (APT) family kinase protein